MALTDALTKDLLGKDSINSISKSTGADADQIAKLITAALPVLISGMSQNAESKEGAKSLATALEAHATNKKEDAAQMLSEVDTDDGAKVVQHILGDKAEAITSGLSNKTNLTSDQVTSTLSMLAPVLLSLLGSHSTTGKDNSVDAGGLGGVLTTLLLGNNNTSTKDSGLDLGSIATALLGGGKDESSGGSVAGSLIGSLLGGGNKKDSGNDLMGAAGSIIGGILGGATSGKDKKQDSPIDAIGNLLGSLLK